MSPRNLQLVSPVTLLLYFVSPGTNYPLSVQVLLGTVLLQEEEEVGSLAPSLHQVKLALDGAVAGAEEEVLQLLLISHLWGLKLPLLLEVV